MDKKMNWTFLSAVIMVQSVITVKGLCPLKCTCDDTNLIVKCIESNLENMPNTLHPRLKTIIYKYNNFPTVDVSLKFLPELRKIDLSHNRIVSVTDKAFSRQGNLGELSLSSNKITQISDKTFYGLDNLKVLSLRHNNIEELRADLFVHSTKIEKLDFSKNRISVIHRNAFKDLTELRILHLSGNFLEVVPKISFSKHLAEFYLANNRLNLIGPSFRDLPDLNDLDLSGNSLLSLNAETFTGLIKLRKLKLSDNNLTSVDPKAFTPLQNTLEELRLGQNPFNSLSGSFLRNLNRLRIFDLSGCDQLRYIGSEVLRGSTARLEHLTIAENRHLSNIHGNILGENAAPNLKRVDLADNGLTGLQENLIPWHRVKYLDLSGNPWNCDCDLIFINRLLYKLAANVTNRILPDAITSTECHNPKELRNKPVYSLKSTDFDGCIVSPGNTGGLNGRSSSETEKLLVIISVVIVVSVLALSITLFVIVRCRKNFSRFITYKETYRWKIDQDSSAAKHYGPDEDFFIQLAQQGTISRPIPVTEL